MPTYRQFLEQHEYFAGRVTEWRKVYDGDKSQYDKVNQEYVRASPEDRPALDDEFKNAHDALQRSEKGLSDATKELQNYENQYPEFDDARRDNVQPPPTEQEKAESTGQAWINAAAIGGLVTQLQVAVPNMDQEQHVTNISSEQQLQNEQQAGETFAQKHADEIRKQLDEQVELLDKDPLEKKEDYEKRGEEWQKGNELVDKANENAPKKSGDDIKPPSDPFAGRASETQSYETSATFGQQANFPDPEKSGNSLGRSSTPANDNDPSRAVANDNTPSRAAANDNIPQPSDGAALSRSSSAPASIPDPNPPASSIATAPAPANDNHPRAANDNDR